MCLNSYRKDKAHHADSRFYEDIRLKCELEPKAKKELDKIGQHPSSTSVSFNFSRSGDYLADLHVRSNLEPLFNALAEIEVSNRVISSSTNAIQLIEAQLDTFYAWVETKEYRKFATAYGKLQGVQKRIIRQTQMQSIPHV